MKRATPPWPDEGDLPPGVPVGSGKSLPVRPPNRQIRIVGFLGVKTSPQKLELISQRIRNYLRALDYGAVAVHRVKTDANGQSLLMVSVLTEERYRKTALRAFEELGLLQISVVDPRLTLKQILWKLIGSSSASANGFEFEMKKRGLGGGRSKRRSQDSF